MANRRKEGHGHSIYLLFKLLLVFSLVILVSSLALKVLAPELSQRLAVGWGSLRNHLSSDEPELLWRHPSLQVRLFLPTIAAAFLIIEIICRMSSTQAAAMRNVVYLIGFYGTYLAFGEGQFILFTLHMTATVFGLYGMFRAQKGWSMGGRVSFNILSAATFLLIRFYENYSSGGYV